MADWDEHGIQRRVAGHHDFRLDGVADILSRSRGAAVLDLGCNRGMVCLEFAHHGANLVHGCDVYEKGIQTAKEVFADIRQTGSKFGVVDLTVNGALETFVAGQKYDIVLMLATYHKLKRLLEPNALSQFMRILAGMTGRYFVWRGPISREEAEAEAKQIDKDLKDSGFRRVQTSTISHTIGMAAIWERTQ
jgi:SAM-dependent methyltransferase